MKNSSKTNLTPRLASLPPLPSAARNRAFQGCECGCGGQTLRSFVPGHDSRLKGLVLRKLKGVMDDDAIEAFAGPDGLAAVNATLTNAARIKAWKLEEALAEFNEAQDAERTGTEG